jgi:hypothetical protein
MYNAGGLMGNTNQEVFVEIVAKKKGCVLCDLAIGILEEISPEFADVVFFIPAIVMYEVRKKHL